MSTDKRAPFTSWTPKTRSSARFLRTARSRLLREITILGQWRSCNRGSIGRSTRCRDSSAGNVYVSESNTIRRISTDGIITNLVGNGVPGIAADGRTPVKARGAFARSPAVDAEGTLYYSDSINHEVWRITPSARKVQARGSRLLRGRRARHGRSVVLPVRHRSDRMGNLYIADSGNSHIQKCPPVERSLQSQEMGLKTVGPRRASYRCCGDMGWLALDASGNIYTARDNKSNTCGGRLRRISTDGTISLLMANDSATAFQHRKPAIHPWSIIQVK